MDAADARDFAPGGDEDGGGRGDCGGHGDGRAGGGGALGDGRANDYGYNGAHGCGEGGRGDYADYNSGSGDYVGGSYDAIVVGAGHAGCEAALAAARLGLKTLVLCINLDSIANMPCNPSIGGTGKGHLVREVDALGGEMGRAADRNTIQSRMLNRAKGPAVFSLRAQVDRRSYQRYMKMALESQPNLDVRQAEAVEILTARGGVSASDGGASARSSDASAQGGGALLQNSGASAPNGDESARGGGASAQSGDVSAPARPAPRGQGDCRPRVAGVRVHTGTVFAAKSVILATGTYLKARVIVGDYSRESGPDGLFAAGPLSGCLRGLGVRLLRFKTGTPARVNGRSVDFAKMEEQPG
ncbi:MAG: FAD-dependent oxidoreductase, partial [Clostridiales bacterium]|nr:FAD-dependent oxidoreductase [Clostridiales bacterium]